MSIFKDIVRDKIFRIILLIIVIIFLGIFLILFIQYNIDRNKGVHAKFLWFETNIQRNQVDSTNINSAQTDPVKNDINVSQGEHKEKISIQSPEKQHIQAKNVNTGNNFGNIGDTYTGIEQRHISENEMEDIISQIKKFESDYSDKINRSHLTIGYPGDKETKILANEIYKGLLKRNVTNVETMMLMTYGVSGKKYGISNAPDNSIMIEIYPADNVK